MKTNYKALKMPTSSKYWVANLDTGEVINDSFPDKFMAEEWIKHQHKLQDMKLFLIETKMRETFLVKARLKIEALRLAKDESDWSDKDWEDCTCNEVSLNHHDGNCIVLRTSETLWGYRVVVEDSKGVKK
jgi:hypothetical protein